MAQKKGQYDMQDLVVEGTNQPASSLVQKGQYSPRDIVKAPDTKGQLEALTSTTPQSLEPGSVADIANPVASATGTSTTSLPRSGLNLLGATGAEVEKRLGIDPNNQISSIPGAIKSNVEGAVNLYKNLTAGNPSQMLSGLSDLYHGVVEGPGQMKEGIQQSDPDKFVGGLVGTAMQTVPAVEGAWNAGKAIKAGLSTPVQPQFDPTKPKVDLPKVDKYKSRLAEVHGGQSSYELKNKLENETIPGATPDLKQGELELFNRPVKTTEEHFAILKHSAQKVWDEYKPYLDQGSTIDGNDVVKRAIGEYDPSVAKNHPEDFATFKEKVQSAFGDQKLSPAEAQHRLTQLNAEAQGFYASENAQDLAARAKLSGAQRYLATGNALRDVLDEHLPEGAGEVRKRYGYLAELMGGMPMPSEAGMPFFKAIFSESAKAMSTRPGYAMARGAMRAAGRAGTDKLVRQAYADMPYSGDPKTSPTTTITNPLTGEKQTVPVGPKAATPVVAPTQNPHPMKPSAVLHGNQPLEIPPNPLEVQRTEGVNNNPPVTMAGHPPTGLSSNSGVAQSPIHPPVVGTELPNVTPSQAPLLPHQLEVARQVAERMNSAPHGAIPSGLNTTVRTTGGLMPHETEAAANAEIASRNIPSDSTPHAPIPTGLNTSGLLSDPRLPGQEPFPTPLTHALTDVGYSQIDGLPPTRKVPEWRGMPASNPLYGQPPADLPVKSPSDVRYQGVRPGFVPSVEMNLRNQGTFSGGLPQSGLPMQSPSPETFNKIGKEVGKIKIKTGLRK